MYLNVATLALRRGSEVGYGGYLEDGVPVADKRSRGRKAARSRRRGATLEQSILRAAADELLAVGYAGLAMDRVAERAGTNKNAIYRRWPSRAALAVAAYRQIAAGDEPLPDTGALRDDALELLRRANRAWASPVGAIHRGLLAGV